MNTSSLPNRLREERVRRKWRQRDVADHLGTTVVTVRRWEQGRQQPSAYFRLKLCALFGKSAEELGLLPGEESQESESQQESRLFLLDPLVPSLHLMASSLIGRTKALQQVIDSLCTFREPSSALVGLPGVGKTSLAISLAHHPQIRQHFPDGILWVGLGPTPLRSETLSRWGSVLELPLADLQTLTTPEAWARALHHALAQRRMLLILDDAWTLADAVFFRLGGPQCAHLLTTRFPPLAHAFADDHVLQLHELSESESFTLLQQVAPRIPQKHLNHLLRLIHLVGGLPLALMLLGRHLQILALSGPPRRLTQALERLCTNLQARFSVEEPLPSWTAPAVLPDMALSLRCTIDLSVHALPIAAQEAFSALSIFPPKPCTFSEDAACNVGNLSLETLDLLIDSGLVELAGEDRYCIHQTLVDYAHLRELEPEVGVRLVTYITNFVEAHQKNFFVLEQELPVITRAFEVAIARKLYQPLLDGMFALLPFLEHRHLTTLAESWVGHAQHAANQLSDQQSLTRTWLFAGKIAELRGDYPRAQQAYVEGLALAQRLPSHDLLAQLLILEGCILVNLGETSRQAEAYLIEGLQVLDEWEGDEHHASRCMIFQHLGELADSRGEEEHANRFYQQGLQLARETQQWYIASALLQNLGVKADRRGDYSQANLYYEEGMAYARQINHLQRQSALLMNMGMLSWHQGQYEAAIALSEESLRLARQIEHQMRISSVLQNLGMMMRVQGQYAQAAVYLTESLALAQQIGHQWLIVETLGEWGLLYLKQRQSVKARQTFEEMKEQAEVMQAPMLIAQALFGLAQVTEQEGGYAQALVLAQESQAIFRKLNHELGLQEIESWQRARASTMIDTQK